MTAQTGGAMDAHQAASSDEAFDALLAASSLGSPRVQAMRRRTPEAVRERLASRLARRNFQPLEQPAQPPLSAPDALDEGRESRYLPDVGSGSHRSKQVENERKTCGKLNFVPHSALRMRTPSHVFDLDEIVTGAMVRYYVSAPLDGISSTYQGSFTAADASVKTRLLTQLSFADLISRCGRIGRYGMGVKLTFACALTPETAWYFGDPSGGLHGNEVLPCVERHPRTRVDWLQSYEWNFLDDSWGRRDSSTAHFAAAVRSALVTSGLKYWLGVWADTADHCEGGMAAPTGAIIAQIGKQVLGMSTAHRSLRCYPRRRGNVPDIADRALLLSAAVISCRADRGRMRTPADESNQGGKKGYWPHFIAPHWPESPDRSRAVLQAAWDNGVCLPPAPRVCLTSQMAWRDVLAVSAVRQAAGEAGKAFNRTVGGSAHWPTHQYDMRAVPPSTYPWLDDRMSPPAPGLLMVTGTEEQLWTEQSEEPGLLPMAVSSLWPAVAGSSTPMSRASSTERAHEEAMVRAINKLITLADDCSALGDPYAAQAAFGPSGEQNPWRLSRDLLLARLKEPFVYSNTGTGTGTANGQSGDGADARVRIGLITAEDVAALMKQADLDLARFFGSEDCGITNEPYREPSAHDAVLEKSPENADLH